MVAPNTPVLKHVFDASSALSVLPSNISLPGLRFESMFEEAEHGRSAKR
jgi:hypothetical protein